MVIETVLALAGGALMGSRARRPCSGSSRRFGSAARSHATLVTDSTPSSTFGKRLADRVAEVGGSWAFVIAFFVFLLAWTGLNTVALPEADRLDPYPFIFLNLLLSMLAAIQAPIIMMSQNCQAAKDRIEARHDFEVNLKAELEILALHEKLDRLHADHGAQLSALLELLRERIVDRPVT